MFAPNFSNLAPALVSTAELDPLRDEGECYGAKLKAAGNRVESNRFLGAPHTFIALDGILESGREYNHKVVAAMKRELLA
jgi:acetyl esterase/lipase